MTKGLGLEGLSYMGLLKEIEPVQAVKGNTVIEQDRDNEK
ncbi:hypothetical protein IFVP182_C2140019 [Vibrio parahaemolyticus]